MILKHWTMSHCSIVMNKYLELFEFPVVQVQHSCNEDCHQKPEENFSSLFITISDQLMTCYHLIRAVHSSHIFTIKKIAFGQENYLVFSIFQIFIPIFSFYGFKTITEKKNLVLKNTWDTYVPTGAKVLIFM